MSAVASIRAFCRPGRVTISHRRPRPISLACFFFFFYSRSGFRIKNFDLGKKNVVFLFSYLFVVFEGVKSRWLKQLHTVTNSNTGPFEFG